MKAAVLGTATFGAQVSEVDARRMVAHARAQGMSTFDTANVYNGGASEEILGRILSPVRDKVLISTKVGAQPMHAPQEGSLSRKAIRRELAQSLKRLKTDYVDVYYMHKPDRETPIEQTLEALDEVVREGKVRQIGYSNFAAWQAAEMILIAQREGWAIPRISQLLYNLIARGIEDEYLAFSRKFGVSNAIYNPLAGGLLTGKYSLHDRPESGSRFSNPVYRRRYWGERQFGAVHDLQAIAVQAGMTLIELSYRWLLSRDVVSSLLIGASTAEQLESNLKSVAGGTPEPDVLAAVDAVWHRLGAAAPRYNR